VEYTEEISKEGEEKESVLYKRKAHFSCRIVDIIISIVVFLGFIFSAIFFNLKFLYIPLILPIVYLIMRFRFRDMFIITNKRFIHYRGKDDFEVVPIDAIVDIEFQKTTNENTSMANLMVITAKEFGHRLLIDNNGEFGIIDLSFVPRPVTFKDLINKLKIDSGSFIKSELSLSD